MTQGASGPTEYGYHSDNEMFQCWKEYQYARVRNIRVPATQLKSHFTVGLGFHAGRARWFRQGFKNDAATWASIRKAVQGELEAQKLPSKLGAEQRALELLREYVEHWSQGPKPKVLAAELRTGPVLATKAPMVGDFRRTAALDDVSLYPDIGMGKAVGEAKTTSQDINSVVKYYEQHPQILTQRLVYDLDPRNGAKRLGGVLGHMLDIVKKPSGDKKAQFARVFIPVERRQMEWFRKELVANLAHKATVTWNSDERRNTSSCTRVIAGVIVRCPFLDLCKLGKDAANQFMVGDTYMTAWRPSPGKEAAPWE
jgi:hypothetical protein